MEHIRIRKFNTKDTYPEQNLDNDLCHAVVTEGGKIAWLRGQCPQNLDNSVNIDSNDPVEQTHKVMKNIAQLINEAGGEIKHLYGDEALEAGNKFTTHQSILLSKILTTGASAVVKRLRPKVNKGTANERLANIAGVTYYILKEN